MKKILLLRKFKKSSLKNITTDRFYFCISGNFLDNESKISNAILNLNITNEPIVILNSDIFPDKSYPKVSNSFNMDFSRYSDLFNKENSINPPLQHFNRIHNDIDETESINYYENSLPYDNNDLNLFFPTNLIRSQNNQNNNIFDSDYISDDDEQDFNTNHRYQNEEFLDTNRRYTAQELLDHVLIEEFEGSEPLNESEYQESDLFGHFIGRMNRTRESDEIIRENNYLDNLIQPNTDSLQRAMNIVYDNPDSENMGIYEFGLLMYQTLTGISETENNQIEQNNHNLNIHNFLNYNLDQNQDNQNMQNIPQDRNTYNNLANPLVSIERERNNLNQQIIESLNLNINLTEADNQAISRLVEAGYDRATVIQVYEACDKNEDAALNLLVSMG